MSEKAEIHEVWMVLETIDGYGRPGETVGYFSNKDLAKAAAFGKGWYGGEGAIDQCWVIRLPSGEIYALRHKETIRLNVDMVTERKQNVAAAKDKLKTFMSNEELSLLGIKL